MNSVTLIGRLVRDPEVRYAQNGTGIARYTLAVDRAYKREGEPSADFLPCVAFGKQAEFAEKYLVKGMRIAIQGRIQTGSYDGKDGKKVYTTDIIVERHEFCESRNQNQGQNQAQARPTPVNDDEGFMPVGNIDNSELPFA